MSWMFDTATSFNKNLSEWDTGSVTDMLGMFEDATSFNGNISEWDTGSVTNMQGMFARAFSFNQDLSSWDITNVKNMGKMFFFATSLKTCILEWDLSNVLQTFDMFTNTICTNTDHPGFIWIIVQYLLGFSVCSGIFYFLHSKAFYFVHIEEMVETSLPDASPPLAVQDPTAPLETDPPPTRSEEMDEEALNEAHQALSPPFGTAQSLTDSEPVLEKTEDPPCPLEIYPTFVRPGSMIKRRESFTFGGYQQVKVFESFF